MIKSGKDAGYVKIRPVNGVFEDLCTKTTSKYLNSRELSLMISIRAVKSASV